MRKRAAVLGSPISHSLSPAIHNAACLALGIEGKYDAVEVKENELEGFIHEVDRTPADWIGFSLTMPLKEAIFKVADVVDPLAKQIFSANTLIPTDDGWYATSTDVAGFIWALAENDALFSPLNARLDDQLRVLCLSYSNGISAPTVTKLVRVYKCDLVSGVRTWVHLPDEDINL